MSRFRQLEMFGDAADNLLSGGRAYNFEDVSAAASAAARGNTSSANIPTSSGASRGFWDQARQNADKTTAWAKEQAEIAARTFGRGTRAVGTGVRNLPGPIKTAGATALGAGALAAAGATAYGAFNMLSGRAPFDGPDMPGSPEAQDAAARQQAQDQLNRYAQLAQETQLKSGEMARIAEQMNIMGAQDLQQQEALENMYIGIEDKRNKMLLAIEAAMQPYYSASRLRERLPEMSRNSYNFINNLVASRGSMR